MGQDEPFVRLAQVEIRCIAGIQGGAEPNRRDADVGRHVAFGAGAQGIHHRMGVAAAAVNVIDDEQPILAAQILQQVLLAVNANGPPRFRRRLVLLAPGVGGAQGDVVGFDAQGGQALLHDDADGAAAAPNADDERGLEAALEDAPAQPEAIENVFRLVDEDLVQRCLGAGLETARGGLYSVAVGGLAVG